MNARRLLLVFVMPFLLVFALSASANSDRNARSTQLRPVSTALAQYDPLTFRAFVGRRQVWQAASLDPTLFPCVRPLAGSALPATASRCDPAGDITPAGDSVLFNALLCYSGGRAVARPWPPRKGRMAAGGVRRCTSAGKTRGPAATARPPSRATTSWARSALPGRDAGCPGRGALAGLDG